MNSIEEAIKTPLFKGSIEIGKLHIVSDCSTNNTRVIMPYKVNDVVFLYEALMLGNINGNQISCYLIGEHQMRKLLVNNNTFNIRIKLTDPSDGVWEFLPLPTDSKDLVREKTSKCIDIVKRNKQHNINLIKQVFNKFTEFVDATYSK